eukprot:scaffold63188_cov106-Cyclotella_meneghiniana.AAC.1
MKAGNTSRPNSFGSSKSSDHNFEAQQQQQQPKEAPVFHNTQRRKGEMLSIMYENDDDGNNDNNNVDSRNSTATYNSLPPSAILGKGATSMVRLAWRKSNKPNNNSSKRASSLDTNSDTEDNEAAAAAAMKITPDLKAIAARNEYRPTGQKAKSRRSVIRVISQPSIDNRSISSSKGDLVAVKLIQKSVLKQMKTMTRDSASNRVT